MRRTVGLTSLLVVVALLLWSASLAHAVCFSCGAYCSGCCPNGGGCVYSPSTDYCVITCEGGSGGPGDCEGQRDPCAITMAPLPDDAPITIPVTRGPIEDLLGQISEASGVAVIAPAFKGRTIRAEARGERVVDFLHRIGSEVGAVPVFLGRLGSMELVPKARLSSRAFSSNAPAADLRMTVDFRDVGVAPAVRAIARVAGIDIVVPSGLGGRVSGSFGEMSWRQMLESVLEASGSRAQIDERANGLVVITPFRTR